MGHDFSLRSSYADFWLDIFCPLSAPLFFLHAFLLLLYAKKFPIEARKKGEREKKSRHLHGLISFLLFKTEMKCLVIDIEFVRRGWNFPCLKKFNKIEFKWQNNRLICSKNNRNMQGISPTKNFYFRLIFRIFKGSSE